MANESRLEERREWAYVWNRSEWKRRFLVLTPGALRIFSSDKKSKPKRSVSLGGCSVGVQGPFSSQKISQDKSSSDSRLWKNLSKLAASDHNFSLVDATIVTLEPKKGKGCRLSFPSKNEAECWKIGLEEAAALADPHNSKKSSKNLSKGSTASSPSSDSFNSTRMFTKTNSLLRRPFGLKWEACPALQEDYDECISRERHSTNTEDKSGSEKVQSVEVIPLDPIWPDLETLQGCTDFLRSCCLNVNALEHAALMIDHFKGSYQMGDSSLPDELRLEAWRGTMRRIVKTLVELLLASNPSLDSCSVNDEHMDQLWLACEVWVLGAVHDKIMGACKQMFAVNDASLDAILAKLHKVDPSKLGVRAEFEDFVLGEAFQQFRMLSRLRTPFEKALCLRKTVNCIINGIQSLIKSCTGALKDTEGLLPCTDDLLSFMLLLMARAKVKNLHANACYMENFLNLHKEESNKGELAYHITNFVAACNYLKSASIQELVTDISLPSPFPVTVLPPSQHWSPIEDESSSSNQCNYDIYANNFPITTANINSSHVHSGQLTSSLSSVRADAESRYPEDNQRFQEEKSCFDGHAFNNWKNCNRMHGNITGFTSECLDFEKPWVPEMPTKEREEWRADTSWFESENFRSSGECLIFQRAIRKAEDMAFPGGSPEFILAPTYQ